MATGTRVFLAVFGLLVGAMVLYYTTIGAPDRPRLDLAATDLAEVDPDALQPTWPIEEELLPAQGETPAVAAFVPAPVAPALPDEISMGETARRPVDPGASVAALPRAAASTQMHDYFVQPGDSLSAIAGQWFGDEGLWDLIAGANPQVDPNRLRPGDLIRLPSRETRRVPRAAPAGGGKGAYVVASGDTLSDIAKAVYGQASRWREIFEANREALAGDPNRLKVGMTLRIP